MMKQTLVVLSLTVGLLSLPLATATAQGPGGRPSGRPGGWGGGMGMRNNPKMRLDRTWRSLGRLQSGSTALTKAQARRVVALVRPWGSRPTMSDTEAQALNSKLNAVLTPQQRNEVSQDRGPGGRGGRGDWGGRGPRDGGGPGGDRGPRGGGRGPGGGGWGGPGGGPGGPGGGFDPQRMEQMRAQMEKMRGLLQTVNPFYPPTRYKQRVWSS